MTFSDHIDPMSGRQHAYDPLACRETGARVTRVPLGHLNDAAPVTRAEVEAAALACINTTSSVDFVRAWTALTALLTRLFAERDEARAALERSRVESLRGDKVVPHEEE